MINTNSCTTLKIEELCLYLYRSFTKNSYNVDYSPYFLFIFKFDIYRSYTETHKMFDFIYN